MRKCVVVLIFGNRGDEIWNALGDGFTLFSFGDGDVSGFEVAASARLVPLKIVKATSTALADVYGTEMILVRPDQFVAWTKSGEALDPVAVINRAIGADI